MILFIRISALVVAAVCVALSPFAGFAPPFFVIAILITPIFAPLARQKWKTYFGVLATIAFVIICVRQITYDVCYHIAYARGRAAALESIEDGSAYRFARQIRSGMMCRVYDELNPNVADFDGYRRGVDDTLPEVATITGEAFMKLERLGGRVEGGTEYVAIYNDQLSDDDIALLGGLAITARRFNQKQLQIEPSNTCAI